VLFSPDVKLPWHTPPVSVVSHRILRGGNEIPREVTSEDYFEADCWPPCPGSVRGCTARVRRLREIVDLSSPSADIPEKPRRYYAWLTSDPISIEKVLSAKTA
jgi:hypothetical protein